MNLNNLISDIDNEGNIKITLTYKEATRFHNWLASTPINKVLNEEAKDIRNILYSHLRLCEMSNINQVVETPKKKGLFSKYFRK